MARPKLLLTHEVLTSLLHYDPETGVFRWKVDRQGHARAGDVAGSRPPYGYVDIMVGGRRYGAHRLAWFYVHGKWPDGQIDHMNCVRDDNRISNLRDVPGSINRQNLRSPHRDNQTGFLGVMKNGRRFAARIQVDHKYQNLGNFKTPEEAASAYIEAKRRIHVGSTL